MAVIDQNQNGNAGGTQMGEKIADAMAGAQQQQGGNARRQGMFSFVDIGSLARAPMGRNPQGEILTKLARALDESYELKDFDFNCVNEPRCIYF